MSFKAIFKKKFFIGLITFAFFSGLVFVFGRFDIFREKRIQIPAEEFARLSTADQDSAIKKWSSEGVAFKEIYKFVADAYPAGHPEKHVLAHTLGEAAVKQHGLEGFGLCDPLLSYGCYHGAALAAARTYGYDPMLGEKLWAACEARARLPGDCLHGLGHAVMVIERYDLVKAYGECETIFIGEDEPEKKSFWCKDGVSMENVERSLAEKNLPPYGRADNLYYPCDSLPERHQPVCYRDHVSYLKNQLGFSKKQVSDFCLTLSEESARLCFDMTGSLVNRVRPAEDAAIFCPEGKYEATCAIGAASALSMERLYEEAESVCQMLSGDGRAECDARIESIRGDSAVPRRGR